VFSARPKPHLSTRRQLHRSGLDAAGKAAREGTNEAKATAADTGQCQRNGCAKVGPQRFDERLRLTAFICAACFESLQLYELRRLFQEVGVQEKLDESGST
jgi:hypothetical protein